jgi:hypothetical protein
MSEDRRPSRPPRQPRQPIAASVALFALVLLAVACAAYRQQHAPAPRRAAAAAHAPAATPASDDFKALADDAQGARVRGEAEVVKASLARRGDYSCCIRPTCNECLLKRGHCHCRDIAAKGGPCCGECTEVWVKDRGAVEALDAVELLRKKVAMLDEEDGPAAK